MKYQTAKCFNTLFKAFLLMSFGVAMSIKLEDISEHCPENFIPVDNETDSWDNAAQFIDDETYFIPFASKYNAYLLTQNVFKANNFEYLTESHLENSCFTMNKLDGWDLVNVTGYGYGGKSLPVHLTPTSITKVFYFTLPYPNGGIGGYASIVLSDNETYNLFDYCFNNGLRAFAVVSTTSSLEETKRAAIAAHVKSLGYNERNFIYLNYTSCLDSNGNIRPTAGDLPRPAKPQTL